MENHEQKIEEAAIKCVNGNSAMRESPFSCFISGAKSPEAKEYWRQGMYSEEEVKSLIQKFNKDQCASKWYEDDENWFEQNKKK